MVINDYYVRKHFTLRNINEPEKVRVKEAINQSISSATEQRDNHMASSHPPHPHYPNQQQQQQPSSNRAGQQPVSQNYPPMAASNPAYAAALQTQQKQQKQQQAALRYYQTQQQRSNTTAPGGVYVGGATVIRGSNNSQSKRSTAASNNNNSTAAANARSTVPAPPPPPGKYVSEALKVLGSSYDISSNKKKQRSEHISDLEQLVPSLFSQSAVHSSSLEETFEGDSCSYTKEDAASKEVVEGSIKNEGGKESNNKRTLERLKLQLQQCKEQNQQEKKRRRVFVSNFVSFHTMYESGLDFIARMGDLRNVPDNVMADEIPKV